MRTHHLTPASTFAVALCVTMTQAYSEPAYIYEQDRLIPDGTSHLGFGYAVCIYDEYIGATGPYMFFNDQTQTSATFGNANAYGIDINESKAIIGSYAGPNGLAILYDIPTFTQIDTLTPDPSDKTFEYGHRVVLTDQYMLVSAPDARNRNNFGLVYVYDLETHELLWKLKKNTQGYAGDDFGAGLAATGSYAIVGAPGEHSGKGAVYIFDLETGQQQRRIVAPDRTNLDHFGADIDAFGTTVAIGAYSYRGPADGIDFDGAVFLLDLTTGDITDTILNPHPTANSQFGSSVALNEKYLVVGHKLDDDFGSNAGIAHLYSLESGTRIAKLRAIDHGPADGFGQDVALSGNTIVVGANLGSGNYASIFTIPDLFDCPLDLNLDGTLNFFDVSVYIEAFIANDPQADCNRDGVFDAFDVLQFSSAFAEGCP